MPYYEYIRDQIAKASWLGGDETGAKINGKKAWFWVFQNKSFTYLKAASSRGYESIIETFEDGFPHSVYVSDSLPAQLKVKTYAKQLCLAHLLRELKNFETAFNSQWAKDLKEVLKNAISYKNQMTETDYQEGNPKVIQFEKRLSNLLEIDYSEEHKKQKALIKRLIKRRESIFTFLYHAEVPPDNNSSERAIRNLKVKMKISNQFKSDIFAQYYAILRSVIDTSIKKSNDVFDTLQKAANNQLISAE